MLASIKQFIWTEIIIHLLLWKIKKEILTRYNTGDVVWHIVFWNKLVVTRLITHDNLYWDIISTDKRVRKLGGPI